MERAVKKEKKKRKRGKGIKLARRKKRKEKRGKDIVLAFRTKVPAAKSRYTFVTEKSLNIL